MSIKDQYDTFDLRSTAGGDAAWANDRPTTDSTVVERLRDSKTMTFTLSTTSP